MSSTPAGSFEMKGYFPGVVGEIVKIHATYYHEHWGFDISFETQVGRELSEFMSRYRPDRDFFQVAVAEDQFSGSITIDAGQDADEGVRLRWFIVHSGCQGKGIGRTLLRDAIDFCSRAGHRRVFLWTFHGLDQARSLYEKAGFRLIEENEVAQWGSRIREQKFELLL